MNILRRSWQRIIPFKVLAFIRLIMDSKSQKSRRLAVLEYYNKIDRNKIDPEILDGLKYLKSHKYVWFPFLWAQKYEKFFPKVFRDSVHQRFFVLFEGKRMYFPQKFTEPSVIWAVRNIYTEQDTESPHRYLTDGFQVDINSVIIDAGVAEGNFALSVVEKAKRLYLIECEAEWVEALRLTFAPWKEKVIFVEKYLSDSEGELTVSIDSLLKPVDNEKYFIKMDIGGFEQKALAGIKNLVASGNAIKMDVCTYHQPNAFMEISAILDDYGFNCQVSKGYVLFFQPGEEPTFRKVLIRAEKV